MKGQAVTPFSEDPANLAFIKARNRVSGNAKVWSAADYHIAGISELVAGANDNAVASLERSLVAATGIRDSQRAASISTDYGLLTDLSTAYLSRGASQGRMPDYVRALTCADRAWRLRQTPETSWNRALSLQRLHLIDDAREAWQDYLQRDPSSPWSTEARERRKETEASTESDLWLKDGGRLLDVPPAQIERLSLLFPLQARRAAEKDILPAWAAAVLGGDQGKAAACLERVDVIGATLARTSGEALLFDVSSGIHASASNPAALKGLARAVMTIADAKSAYDQLNGAECRTKLRAVIPELIRYRCPLVHYARFYVASSYYFDNDYASMRREAASLTDIPKRYMALRAQTSWILGLGEMSTGRPEGALPYYLMALAEFTRLGESDYVAAVHNLLAEACDYLDSPDEAWTHREQALELVTRIGPASSQWVQVLQGSAQLLLAMQQPTVAKVLLDRTLKLPAAATDPYFQADTMSWQAVALHQLGRDAEAEAAWKVAASSAGKIRATGARERALNNVVLTRAMTLERGVTPAEAQQAVAFAQNGDNRWALPRLLLLQADVNSRNGAYDQAMRGYLAAIDEIVDQRRKTSIMRNELLNRSCLSDVTEHALSLAISRGDYESAFRFSEHSAGAAFRDAPRAALPRVAPNVAILKIVCLSDRMLIWTITARGMHSRQISIALETVRAASDGMAGRSRPEAASLLGRMIISPGVIGSAVDTLVFVPDAAVATVPFEALIDPSTRKPLIDRFVIAECPTVASYMQAAAVPANPSGVALPLLVDGAQPGDMPRLPEAAAEIRRLKQLYPTAGVWKSDRQVITALPEALEKAGLIHFAAHGAIDRTNELLSNIVLGTGNRVLYAHEIETLRLVRHPIVILSICSGASTPSSRRRRAPTLADAFLAAGASAIVASSERIDDDQARRFSLLLHERLSRGMAVGPAVREIQLAFVSEGRPWSNMVVVGNPAATFQVRRTSPTS